MTGESQVHLAEALRSNHYPTKERPLKRDKPASTMLSRENKRIRNLKEETENEKEEEEGSAKTAQVSEHLQAISSPASS